MLKETEIEETIVFFYDISIIGSIPIGEARAPWASPLATPMPPEKNFAPGQDKISCTCIVVY